jgi:hypothetical protein
MNADGATMGGVLCTPYGMAYGGRKAASISATTRHACLGGQIKKALFQQQDVWLEEFMAFLRKPLILTIFDGF